MAEPEAPSSYRISDDADQVEREHERLRTLARMLDVTTRSTVLAMGITEGWACCDVGSGAGTVAGWMAEQVGPTGRVVAIDVDTRFQPPSHDALEVRTADVTVEPIGDAEFDLVHARGVLQHIAQREEVVDKMVAALKPGGRIVVTDTDWIQYDAQAIPEPFATLSRTLRNLSVQQNAYDGEWGRRLLAAFEARGLEDVVTTGFSWTMRGGTDSAEWYVAALDRAIQILPAEVFPDGFDPAAAIAQARQPGFAILSPLSMTAVGTKP